MKEIALTKGLVTQIDDDDLERLAAYKWHARKGSKGNFYACRQIRIGFKETCTLQMHRFILNAPSALYIDHIDFNGLNNQKSNLRLATYSENKRHTSMIVTNTSGYKGVIQRKKRWAAQMEVRGQSIWLGTFDTKEEAARCYDAAVIEHFGEFAVTNASLCLYPTKPTTP